MQRGYSYDALGRLLTRTQSRQGGTRNDSFTHNDRSELTAATLGTDAYAYAYDNVGNRLTAQEAAEEATAYTANNLNQYTAIQEGTAEAFAPTYDADGNQTLVKTSTGIWAVTYNVANRPTVFANEATGTVVECSYDSVGRRATKKVTVNGTVTLHQRYIYRGYLQIAALDLTRTAHPCLWLITWDPTQPVATRPLAIQKDGTWYTYGFDLTKNVMEVFGSDGYIKTAYTYTPFGEATASGNVTQPIQWSSEYFDDEVDLAYYNYRFYNPASSIWLSRDPIFEKGGTNLYYIANSLLFCDILGLSISGRLSRYLLYRMILKNGPKSSRQELVKYIRSVKDFHKYFELHHMCSKANVRNLRVDLNLSESVDHLGNLIHLPTPQGKVIIDDLVEQGLLYPHMRNLPVHRGYSRWHRVADQAVSRKLRRTKSISEAAKSMKEELFNGTYKAVPIVIIGANQAFSEETFDDCDIEEKIMSALAQYIEELEKYERKLSSYEWELKRHEETIATMKKYSTDKAKVSTYWNNSVTRFFDDWINPVSIVEFSIDLGTSIHKPTPPDEPIMPEILKRYIK
ncbi:MAG: RHS repeat-associated core domain-containing protein [Akkermansia muciniphila]|nr:RHS repeat-associated core domain-containing protein [Akkermansia muciniphila]